MTKQVHIRTNRPCFFIIILLAWVICTGLGISNKWELWAKAPEVNIENPPGGWTLERSIAITGTISDSSLTSVTMVVNGADFLSRVVAGRFNQKVILANGENHVQVMARNKDGVGKDSIIFFTQLSKVDVQILLTFPPQPFYVDLWITQPDNERCFWSNRTTRNGGTLHDLYLNAPGGGVGRGPQCYTIADALPGEYLIQVDYWAGGYWGVGETTGGPYGSKQTPIVPIKVHVILYEGTEYQQIKTYEAVLKKPGDTFTVGKLSVDPTALDPDHPRVQEIKSYDK